MIATAMKMPTHMLVFLSYAGLSQNNFANKIFANRIIVVILKFLTKNAINSDVVNLFLSEGKAGPFHMHDGEKHVTFPPSRIQQQTA